MFTIFSTLPANRAIRKEFFKFAVPSVLGMVISSLYTVVDGIFVGRGIGALALGSVNIVYPFIMLQIAIAMLLAIGGANLFSSSKGRKDFSRANNIFAQSMSILLAASLIFNFAAILFAEQFCAMMGADETLLAGAANYLAWMALSGIIFMPGLGLSIFIRNDGAPKLEMLGTLCGAVTNIILDYFFIMRFGWGITGAAVATGIGQWVSVAIYATHFRSPQRTLRLTKPRFHLPEIAKIVYNGFSSFLMEFSQSAVALSFNIVIVARIGVAGISAYSVVMYICSIFNMVLIGVVQGAQPIISYNHGCSNNKNVRSVYKMGVFSCLALSLFFYALIFIFGKNLAGLFSKDANLVETAVQMMRCYFLGFFPVGVSLMSILYFQARSREAKSILISVLRCIGFVQLFLLILPGFFGAYGIYLSFFAGETCNCLISMLLFRHDAFAKRRILIHRFSLIPR